MKLNQTVDNVPTLHDNVQPHTNIKIREIIILFW